MQESQLLSARLNQSALPENLGGQASATGSLPLNMSDSQQLATNRQPRISNQKVKRIPLDQIHFSDTYNNRLGGTSNSKREQMLMIDLSAKEEQPRAEATELSSKSPHRGMQPGSHLQIEVNETISPRGPVFFGPGLKAYRTPR